MFVSLLPGVLRLVVTVRVWCPVQVLVVPLLLRGSRATSKMMPRGKVPVVDGWFFNLSVDLLCCYPLFKGKVFEVEADG